MTFCVVVLSLLINGSLTRTLLEALNILAPHPLTLEFLINSLNEMEEYAENHCSHLKTDHLIGDPDWAKAQKSFTAPAVILVRIHSCPVSPSVVFRCWNSATLTAPAWSIRST